MDSIYLKREEAAKYLKVSTRTISQWQRAKLIPFIKAGTKCVRFNRNDLDKLMRDMTVQAVG